MPYNAFISCSHTARMGCRHRDTTHLFDGLLSASWHPSIVPAPALELFVLKRAAEKLIAAR